MKGWVRDGEEVKRVGKVGDVKDLKTSSLCSDDASMFAHKHE